MVRTSMDVASFTCDSFRLIDAWLFSSFNEYYILKKLAKLEKVLTFLSLVFQPRGNNSSCCYYFKTLKYLKIRIIFISNLKYAEDTKESSK